MTVEEKRLVDQLVAQLRGSLSDTAEAFGARVLRHAAKIVRGRRVRTIPISTRDWRIKARILWWIGRAQNVSGSS